MILFSFLQIEFHAHYAVIWEMLKVLNDTVYTYVPTYSIY